MDKFKRNQLRSLMQDDKFRAVEALQKLVIAEIGNNQVKADTEFETIWRTAQREAGIQVLLDFFNRMILEASKADE